MSIVYSGGVPVQFGQRIYSWSSGAATELGSAFSLTGWIADAGGNVSTHPDDVWAQQPAVRTVLGFKARAFAMVALHAFQRRGDDRERVRDTPLARLAAQPSRRSTAFKTMYQMSLDRDLWDRAALILTDTGSGWQLTRIPPRRWGFRRDGLDQPEAVIVRGDDGTTTELPLDRLLWFDDYPGAAVSPMDTLKTVLVELGESAAAKQDLWKKRARIPGVISRPNDAPPWSPDARTNFKRSWQEYAASGANTGKTPVLEDGMVYTPLTTITPADAQQLEAYKFAIGQVAAFWGIPGAFVGLTEATNYSNMQAWKEQLYTEVLGSTFTEAEQSWNAQVVPVVGRPGEFVEFNVQAMLRMNFEAAADILARATGAPVMSRNEARQRMNLPSIPGADGLVEPINVFPDTATTPTA